METYPKADWQRLGRLLKQRRPQLDQRYRIRRVFAEENQLTDKTVQEIENAYRQTFTDEMLSSIEVAYRLPPGTLEKVLQDPELTEFPYEHHSGTATLHLKTSMHASGTAHHVELPADVSLQDLEPWERAIWLVPGLSIEERGLAIQAVRWSRAPNDEDRMTKLFIAMGPTMARLIDAQGNNPSRAG